MSNGTKTFLMGLAAALITFVIFMYFVGLGEDYAFTASGPVDLLNADSIYKARQDPSFEEGIMWGDFKLTAKQIALLFLSLPVLSFLLVVAARILVYRRRPAAS
ncbi:hypothetical protein GCM10027292_23770 [Hydrogenophaga aquatica]